MCHINNNHLKINKNLNYIYHKFINYNITKRNILWVVFENNVTCIFEFQT